MTLAMSVFSVRHALYLCDNASVCKSDCPGIHQLPSQVPIKCGGLDVYAASILPSPPCFLYE